MLNLCYFCQFFKAAVKHETIVGLAHVLYVRLYECAQEHNVPRSIMAYLIYIKNEIEKTSCSFVQQVFSIVIR